MCQRDGPSGLCGEVPEPRGVDKSEGGFFFSGREQFIRVCPVRGKDSLATRPVIKWENVPLPFLVVK